MLLLFQALGSLEDFACRLGIIRAHLHRQTARDRLDGRTHPRRHKGTVRHRRGRVPERGVAGQVTVNDLLEPLAREPWYGTKHDRHAEEAWRGHLVEDDHLVDRFDAGDVVGMGERA